MYSKWATNRATICSTFCTTVIATNFFSFKSTNNCFHSSTISPANRTADRDTVCTTNLLSVELTIKAANKQSDAKTFIKTINSTNKNPNQDSFITTIHSADRSAFAKSNKTTVLSPFSSAQCPTDISAFQEAYITTDCKSNESSNYASFNTTIITTIIAAIVYTKQTTDHTADFTTNKLSKWATYCLPKLSTHWFTHHKT